MRLTVLTPLTTIVERDDLFQVAGRDASGAFAIRPGHADFVTVLDPSVLTLRDGDGHESYCAVSGGLLQVEAGGITVATAQADTGGELEPLIAKIRARTAREAAERQQDTATEHRLQAALIRHMLDSVADDGRAAGRGGP